MYSFEGTEHGILFSLSRWTFLSRTHYRVLDLKQDFLHQRFDILNNQTTSNFFVSYISYFKVNFLNV